MFQFSKYLLTAGAATCADIMVVQALLGLPIHFFLIVVLGALLGMGVNFVLSRQFVFTATSGSRGHQFWPFALVSLSTLLLRLFVSAGLLALLSLPVFSWLHALPFTAATERLSHLGAVSLVTVYSFIAHKHFSFTGGFSSLLATTEVVADAR